MTAVSDETGRVKRYGIHYDIRGEFVHPKGDFVHWFDYQDLAQKLAALSAAPVQPDPIRDVLKRAVEHYRNYSDAVVFSGKNVANILEACIPPGATAPVGTWECSARKQNLPEPADCGWPTCGCDPHADKVIAALEEQGNVAPVAQEPVAWRHKKRGTVYVEVARGPLQASTRQPAEDDTIVCYRGTDGRHFFREATEFEDGRFERVASPVCIPVVEPVADDLRALGWTVAVHNDYRLNGEPHTFWLFTKGDRAIKGEGRSDAEALSAVRSQITTQPAPTASVGAEEIARIADLLFDHPAFKFRYISLAARKDASNELAQFILSRAEGESDQTEPQKDGSR